MGNRSNNLSQGEQVLLQAMQWHAAVSRGDVDWEAFTAWLEQAPGHRDTYNDVALMEEGLSRHRAALQQSYGNTSVSRRSRVWPMGVAAAAVLGVAVWLGWQQLPFVTPAAQTYQARIESQPVALKDGSNIVLAPGSRLSVGGRHQQYLELTGSAYFDVPHDPSRALTIRVGAYTVRDVGTRFEVFGADHALKVAVGDGEVVVDLPGNPGGVRVTAGHRLLVAGTPATAEYASMPAEDVGAWQSGRLPIHGEPLSLVAAQIGLYAGVKVSVEPGVADRRFSGVLAIGEASQLAARLAEIMGLAVRPQGNGMQLFAVGAGQ
jgi:transmembrane sensor